MSSFIVKVHNPKGAAMSCDFVSTRSRIMRHSVLTTPNFIQSLSGVSVSLEIFVSKERTHDAHPILYLGGEPALHANSEADLGGLS